MVQLHESRTDDGIARMRRLDFPTLAPGQAFVLAPGGRHLMLMRPSRDLDAATTIHVDVEAEGCAAPLGIEVPVRAAR
jgi:copper(I)-binding protein